jgi:hypothetical protein
MSDPQKFNAKDFIFRDVLGIMVTVAPHALAFSEVNKHLSKKDNFLDKFLGKLNLPDNFKGYLKESLKGTAMMGAGFASFNVAYDQYKQWYNKRFATSNEGEPQEFQQNEPNAPQTQPEDTAKDEPKKDWVEKVFTEGLGKIIFRDVGSIALGALSLGFVPALVRRVMKQPAADADMTERWKADFAAAATGYAGYYTIVQHTRKSYDTFWENRRERMHNSKSEHPSEHESGREPEQKPEVSEKKGFMAGSLGKLIFRDVGGVYLGFAAHIAIRNWIKSQMGKTDPINPDNPDAIRRFRDGGLLEGVSNWCVDQSGGKITPEIAQEFLATGLGFALGYIGLAVPYRAGYDEIFSGKTAPALPLQPSRA